MKYQKNPSINFNQLKKMSEQKYICPNCRKQTMYRVLGPCITDDGITIEELERFHCLSCDSDFFDLPAMRKIRKFREIKGIDEFEKEAMEYS
jgi:transposase-like protein